LITEVCLYIVIEEQVIAPLFFLWGVKKYHPFLFEEADDILVFE
jgi:hypothetical protein